MSQSQHKKSMHITLTPTLASYVEEQVSSGLYGNSSEVIREALRLQYENKLARLRQAVKVGIDEAENGDFSDKSVQDIVGGLVIKHAEL